MTTNGHALAVYDGPGLAKAEPPIDLSTRFTPEQEDLIRATCCGGASKEEADVLISIAEARGLNPILGECYFVLRDGKWAVQASIDSFRIKAERTGLYVGQDEPEYEYDAKGYLLLARVKVWRRDWPRPSVGVARFEEYAQTKAGGELTRFWKKMPHNQLAKCAEALAMRKAFPAVFSKVYVTEEMDQADNDAHALPARCPPPPPKSDPIAVDMAVYVALAKSIDDAETSADLAPIVTAINAAKEARQIDVAQLIELRRLYAMKQAVIMKAEAAGTDDGAIMKDFEMRFGAATSMVEVKSIGADIHRSSLDEQQRDYLDTVYAVTVDRIGAAA